MSGFYLLALVAIWLFAGWMLFRIWIRWKPAGTSRKVLHIAIGAVLFSIWFGGAFWEAAGKKMYWDAKVRELCAKDGGIRVYETVELTPDKFNGYVRKNWVLPDQTQATPSDDYFYERKVFYIKETDPQVTRRETRIIRRYDRRVLGEYIRYGRGGGDLPGFWPGSSYTCPDSNELKNFESSIFIKGERK